MSYECVLSRVWLFVTLWTAGACQAPLSMGLPRQEYWSELPFPSPGDLPDPGIKPISPALVGGPFITEPSGKPLQNLAVKPSKCTLLSTYIFSHYIPIVPMISQRSVQKKPSILIISLPYMPPQPRIIWLLFLAITWVDKSNEQFLVHISANFLALFNYHAFFYLVTLLILPLLRKHLPDFLQGISLPAF